MENKSTRLSKAARLFNVGISTIVEFLAKKGIQIDSGIQGFTLAFDIDQGLQARQ